MAETALIWRWSGRLSASPSRGALIGLSWRWASARHTRCYFAGSTLVNRNQLLHHLG